MSWQALCRYLWTSDLLAANQELWDSKDIIKLHTTACLPAIPLPCLNHSSLQGTFRSRKVHYVFWAAGKHFVCIVSWSHFSGVNSSSVGELSWRLVVGFQGLPPSVHHVYVTFYRLSLFDASLLRSHTAHEEHVTYSQNMVRTIAWHQFIHKPIRSPGGCPIEVTRRPMGGQWERSMGGLWWNYSGADLKLPGHVSQWPS